jgi:FtsH-binding integral membrane protein
MTRQASDMILAAFCYVTAMMIWEIGNRIVYIGATPLWFVVLICSLVVVSGVTFQFENLISSYERRQKER